MHIKEKIKLIMINIKFSYKINIAWLPKLNAVLENLVFPLISSIFYILVAYKLDGNQELSYFLIGSLCSISLDINIGGTAILVSADKRFRTIHNIITSKYSSVYTFIGRTMYWCILGLVRFILLYVSLTLIFDSGLFDIYKMIQFMGGFLLLSVSISGIGYMIGVIGLWNRSILGFSNFITLVLIILSGVYFPTERLFLPLRIISRILPSTYGIKACRFIIEGGLAKDIVLNLILMSILGVVYSTVGILFYKKFENQILQNQKWELF